MPFILRGKRRGEFSGALPSPTHCQTPPCPGQRLEKFPRRLFPHPPPRVLQFELDPSVSHGPSVSHAYGGSPACS